MSNNSVTEWFAAQMVRIFLFVALLAAGPVMTTSGVLFAASADQGTVLITGANRGIGLEFTRQYAQKGWKVIATCRNPGAATELQMIAGEHPGVVIEQLDVTDHPRIDTLAEKYRDTPIDVLLNNAGISGRHLDSQSAGRIDIDVFNQVMAVNNIGPLKMAEAFLDHVAASREKKIMTVSSSVGSISKPFGGGYIYGPSKAAVDIVMRSMSRDRSVTDRGIIVGLLSPGVVDTDFMKGVPMPKISPQESVAGMIAIIDGFTVETAGTLRRYNGEVVGW